MRHDSCHVVLAAGSGCGNHALTALDAAFFAAGVADFNLLQVSSIVPPGATVTIRTSTARVAGHGIILPAAQGKVTLYEPRRALAAAVGAAVPHNPSHAGVLFVFAGETTSDTARSHVTDMIDEAMMRRGLAAYEVFATAAEIAPGSGYRSAVALAALCDAATMAVLESAE